MGRSSNSSHYQLSANRLISRVHVETRYIAATVPLEPNKVEIKCKGWNGIKLHCQGRTWELAKDDTFTSETEFADIMLDVQDARVLLSWPGQDRKASIESQDSPWEEDENTPTKAGVDEEESEVGPGSVRRDARIRSPESPTPAGPSAKVSLANLFTSSPEPEPVKVFEDAPSPEKQEEEQEDIGDQSFATTQANTSFRYPMANESFASSELSEPEDDEDPDEENDPIVHSFGPFGANLNGRMASFTHGASPEAARARREVYASPKTTKGPDPIPIINHVVNQLAYSRLSSTPLSVILNNLPAELKSTSFSESKLTKEALRDMLLSATSIGEIHREGKDAAGKALESEYYYIPDNDTDEQRRAAVVDTLRKPSLRNCRKQHKVCPPLLPLLLLSSNILTQNSNITGRSLALLELICLCSTCYG